MVEVALLLWQCTSTLLLPWHAVFHSSLEAAIVGFFCSLGLNDEESLDAIETAFKQFNSFLDLMQDRG